jgi:hypothetical protein
VLQDQTKRKLLSPSAVVWGFRVGWDLLRRFYLHSLAGNKEAPIVSSHFGWRQCHMSQSSKSANQLFVLIY